MFVQPISNIANQNPGFGKIKCCLHPDLEGAIKNNECFQRLAAEYEQKGKDLIFNAVNEYGGGSVHMRAGDTYLGMLAGSLPYDVDIMAKRLASYSYEHIQEAIQSGKNYLW